MIKNIDTQNRLYLSQGEDDIYIDNCRVPQHHIEGIRFLYRQFKRHKNGVIINDPFSFGRNIQIILFLKAIRSLLDKSVLILCQEGGEQDWMDRFHTWTDLYDEVVVESKNPTFKKPIIINAMENLPMYCDREWSIIIVDGDKNTSSSILLKFPFRAKFKIWNTPINMKENLDQFKAIYKWLYPNEIFDKYQFIPNADSAVDIIEKTILLDSFMEDIVIRREDLDSSFEKYHREVMPPPKATTTVTATTTSITISKKNKDAAGTKIKRSKKKPVETEETKHIEPTTATLTALIGETSKSYETTECTEDFSIDNYKRKNSEGSSSHALNEPPFKIIEIDSSEQHSDLKLYYEPDSCGTSGGKLEEMDTLVFGHDTFIRKVEDKGNNDEFKCDSDVEPAKVVMYTSSYGESTSKSTTGEKNKSNTDASKCTDVISINVDDIERNNKNEREIRRQNESDITKMNLDRMNKCISDLGIKKYSKGDIVPSSSQENIEINEETQVHTKELNKSNTKDTEQIVNTLKRNNIDDKIKEYEEKVSKKFKGSLLDNLF